MRYLVFLLGFLAVNCSAFQVSKPAEPEPAPASRRDKPVSRSLERAIIKKLVSYVNIVTKPKSVKSNVDKTKSFTYSVVLKSDRQAGNITFEIKPEGDKYRYNCKIVIETLNQEETVEFTSTDAAEVIRELRVSLGGTADDMD